MNNKIFPNKKTLKKLFLDAFYLWCKQNAIPCPPERWLTQQFDPLWTDHQTRLSDHLTAATIRQLQDQFPECIFHNEDKRASSLRIFCPCLYFSCINKTFSDTTIFARSQETPTTCLQVTMQHLRNKFEKSYPWAMGTGNKLPSGYILPKGKKQYASGRPIIGFLTAPFKPMLSTLAKLLFQLIPKGCPDHFARGDVYQLLKLLKEYATTMTNHHLRVYNQDLAGFFISIDTERFLQSWQILLQFLTPHMSTKEEEFFSISPVKQNNPGDIIKGRTFRKLNVNRLLRIGDIPSLIVAALQMQHFQLGSRVYTQVQGSPMGSPLSPALCLMVVSVYEQIWFHTHRESITNLHLHALFLRYVDNRLVILPSTTTEIPAYQILTDADFYKTPIVLEDEPDQEFLGFQLELDPFEMIYQCPRDLSQVLSPWSASPPAVLLSGFASRCSIVQKGAFPQLQITRGLHQLRDLYLRAGFQAEDLDRILHRVSKQRR